MLKCFCDHIKNKVTNGQNRGNHKEEPELWLSELSMGQLSDSMLHDMKNTPTGILPIYTINVSSLILICTLKGKFRVQGLME
jgi:hypothetical protein